MAASVADAPAVSPKTRFRGLALRIASSVVLGPICIAAIWVGFPWIDLMAAIAAPIVVSEWVRLTPRRPLMRTLAIVYGIAALLALLWLRHQPQFGRETVIWIMACVWATDIGAYFVGSLAGGAKLAPSISPNKTWSGLIGGMCIAAVASAACGWAFGLGGSFALAVVGVGIAAVAQAGDLVESLAKRAAGVKDSGHIIPGHGGLLDRIDGLIAALVFVAAMRLIVGGGWPWI